MVRCLRDFHTESLEHDVRTRIDAGEVTHDSEAEVGTIATVALTALQLLLTPPALLVDLVTLPVQLIVLLRIVQNH